MKKTILIPVLVFVIAAGGQFLMNVTNVFDTDWGTWQIVINAGVVAVVSWGIAYSSAIKADLEEIKVENAMLRKLIKDD